jgi:hypothetical protein
MILFLDLLSKHGYQASIYLKSFSYFIKFYYIF